MSKITSELELSYKEGEKNSVFASLVRQWGKKWSARHETRKLRSLTQEDAYVARGGAMSYGDMLDYQDDREKRPFTLTYFYYVEVELENGRTIKGTPGAKSCSEMWAIRSLCDGKDDWRSAKLAELGYEFDPIELASYVVEQKRISDAFEAYYGTEYD